MSIGSKIFLGVVLAIPLSILWLLWSMGILTAIAECDSTDYSPIIKKVAVPMQQELENFYAKNKHFPNTQERNEMLEKVGCKMEGNVCMYKNERISLEIENGKEDYYIRFTIENTGCLYALDIDGEVRDIGCGTSACISLKQ